MEEILRDDIEYIVHSEEDGTIIGPISKIQAHLPGIRESQTHYSTWSMVYHVPDGKYGIQFKNPKKHDKLTAGKWDMGVAGHNCYVKEGESYRPLGFEENLVKEAEEEIGISLKMVRAGEFKDALRAREATGCIFEEFLWKTDTDNEWVGLGFIAVFDTKLEFKDGEVTQFKWLAPEELAAFLKERTDYCSPLPEVFRKAEKFRRELGIK